MSKEHSKISMLVSSEVKQRLDVWRKSKGLNMTSAILFLITNALDSQDLLEAIIQDKKNSAKTNKKAPN